ncbi:hypothetical protein DFR30_1226 [Thiogranum longum]|uniref:DUF5666 domain-containing protein n=1 Tax=Thiogranum longum TaxID=1537524 RepID=A0A4R1HBJ0_9GAMM|nr:DUF5666 domain-containing protein [Thiogranum longum]TCK17971.1 hypothetical protein DFR30_1226 [Thiogranum longum]
MTINKLTKAAGAIAVVLGLSACGGGGSGTTSATAGASSVGTITGFGSIFVNGVEYETRGASIIIDGNPGTESDLAVGMVVELTGSASGATGRALTINASDELEGIVQSNSVAAGTGTMVIMGQTVTVDLNTLFESKVAGVTTIDQVAAGHIVEVSGYSDGTGSVFATRVEVKAPDLATYLIDHPNGVEVKGVVSNLDPAMQTFDIGTMAVSYAGAIIDNDVTLAADLFVEVKSVAGIDGSGVLVASKVELEDDGVKGRQGDDGEEFEIKAVISSPFDGTSFSMDGTTVIVTDNTVFRSGDSSGLQTGILVEAEGNFNATGELVAEKINFEDEGDTEIQGIVADINATGVNSGTVTLQDGSVITVTNSTIMKDSRDNGMTPDTRFNLQALAIGDFVEVHLFVDTTSGDSVAVKLERDDP